MTPVVDFFFFFFLFLLYLSDTSSLRLLFNPPPPTTQPNFTGFLASSPSSPSSFFVRKHRGQEYLTLHTFTCVILAKKKNEKNK